jgi:anti-sigma factor RsiW
MHCRYVKQKLDRYVQGDLPEPMSKKVEQHLHKCRNCADTLSRIKKLEGLFEDTPRPPVPEGFSERLMQCARQRQYLQQSPEPIIIRIWGWFDRTGLKKSVAAAGVIIGLSVGLLMGLQTSRQYQQKQTVNQIASGSGLIDTFRFDYLTEAPENSLSQVYVQMIAGKNNLEE